MPHPYWVWFGLAVALIAVIEWEELVEGHVPRSRIGHVGFALTPLLYVAFAAWMFVASPLVYAAKIRNAAAVACSDHRGLNESAVEVIYAGHRSRSGTLHSGPAHDQIVLLCNDGTARFGGTSAEGVVSLGPFPRPTR